MGYDPFKLEEGMLDDVDVTFTNCRFERDPDYNDGDTTVFKADLVIDDDDYPEPEEKLWACGDGWEPADKGARIEREDGKKKNFNKRSGMGLLVGSMLDDDDAEAELRRRNSESDLTPQDAALYEGMKFHMEVVQINYGGEIGEIPRLLATKYLGLAGDGSSSSAKASPTKSSSGTGATAKKKVVKKVDADSGSDIPEAVMTKLDGIADESESPDEFMELVIDQLPDDEQTDAVLDAIKRTDEGSIWHRACERANG